MIAARKDPEKDKEMTGGDEFVRGSGAQNDNIVGLVHKRSSLEETDRIHGNRSNT